MPSFLSKLLGIIHGRRFPYQILGIADYTAFRLKNDAYLNIWSSKQVRVCSL